MMTLPQQCFYLSLYRFDFIGTGYLNIDGTNIGNPHESFLSCCQRNDDDIILVLPHRRLTFAFDDADDFIRLVVDADIFTDWIFRFKQIGGNRSSDDSDTIAGIEVVLCNKRPGANGQVADFQIFRRDAVYRRIPVFMPIDDLIGAIDRW